MYSISKAFKIINDPLVLFTDRSETPLILRSPPCQFLKVHFQFFAHENSAVAVSRLDRHQLGKDSLKSFRLYCAFCFKNTNR